jgi:hypothetical protein
VSQVVTKRRLSIRNERVKVTARFHEEGSVLKGTQRGSCDGIEIELSMESEEPQAQIAELMRLAHQMCFTEDALTRALKLETRHILNGQVLNGIG